MNTALTYELDGAANEPAEGLRAAHNWKQDVARRVAAHRGRVSRAEVPMAAEPVVAETDEKRRAAKIAAAVAKRYAAAPSYREMMAKPVSLFEAPLFAAVEEQVAEPVVAEIEAAQKKPSASITAEEILMAEIPAEPEASVAPNASRLRIELMPEPAETLAAEVLPVRVMDSPRELVAARKMRPRLAEGPLAAMQGGQLRIFEVVADQISTTPEPPVVEYEAAVLQAALSVTPVPVKTIVDMGDWDEPVVSDYSAARAYEEVAVEEPVAYRVEAYVEPVISHRVELGVESHVERQIEPRKVPRVAVEPGMRECDRAATIVVQTASIEMRIMSMVVDGCVVTTLALVGVMLYFSSLHGAAMPSWKLMVLGGGVGYMALWLAYQVVCLAVSGATLGMRYAQINLCTFEDENPTRAAMCWRAVAQLLSLCPLGLGYLWAWMDMDGLGWHDRMTHVYQKSY